MLNAEKCPVFLLLSANKLVRVADSQDIEFSIWVSSDKSGCNAVTNEQDEANP